MSKIRTIDGHIVTENDLVYEIMYRYYNPEYSDPVPEQRKLKDIPQGTKVWYRKINCHVECQRIKNKIWRNETVL